MNATPTQYDGDAAVSVAADVGAVALEIAEVAARDPRGLLHHTASDERP